MLKKANTKCWFKQERLKKILLFLLLTLSSSVYKFKCLDKVSHLLRPLQWLPWCTDYETQTPPVQAQGLVQPASAFICNHSLPHLPLHAFTGLFLLFLELANLFFALAISSNRIIHPSFIYMPASFSPFRSQFKCHHFKEASLTPYCKQPPPHPHPLSHHSVLTAQHWSLSDFILADLFVCLLSRSSLLYSRAIVSYSPLFLAQSHKNMLTIHSKTVSALFSSTHLHLLLPI